MSTTDPFDNRSSMLENLGMFKAATHAVPTELSEVSINTILVAVDGGNQEAAVLEVAKQLSQRTSANVIQGGIFETVADLVAAIEANKADLVVIDAPYGKDFHDVKSDSLGEFVGLLMVETTCPILCVRRPVSAEEVSTAFKNCVVPLTSMDEAALKSVAWAFSLVSHPGDVELLAVADEDMIKEARRILSDGSDGPADELFSIDRIESMLPKMIAGVTAASHRRSQQAGDIHFHVHVKAGRFIPTVLNELGDRKRLLVWGCDREHDSPSFHRAIDLIYSFCCPILIV